MKFKFPLILVLLLLIVPSLSLAQEETEVASEEILLHVGPFQQSCVGMTEMECLIIRELPDGEVSLFYDAISGFEYEAGYEYQLRVRISESENPPADASALSYELIEVVQMFPASLEGKVWELQSLGDTVVEDPSLFTLNFNAEDNSLGITTDCNSIMATTYTVNPPAIGETGMTMMFCEGSLESPFLAALYSLQIWTIENGELLMQTDEGLLRFAPPIIEGKDWRLQRYTNADMIWEDDGSVDYTLRIDGETAALSLACNSGSATVFREAAALRLEEVISTLMACENDPLAGIFPPMHFVYSVNADGALVLSTTDSEEFVFVEVGAE